jgi:hypothetical protein
MIKNFSNFNEGFVGDITENGETYKVYELLYYAFDWDDNILHMPTEIILLDNEGNEIGMSTGDFAEYRSLVGKEKFDYNGKTIVSFAENPFRNFRDEVDKEIFIKDVEKALMDESLRAKSWNDFIECLTTGSLFSIITARGHEPEPMRRGVELVIDKLSNDDRRKMIEHLKMYKHHFDQKVNIDENKLISDYLDNCEFVGVSAPLKNGNQPSRGGSPENPEKAKEAAFMSFVYKCDKFAKDLETRFNESGVDNWKVFAKIGFSDDDRKNYDHMDKVVSDLMTQNETQKDFIKISQLKNEVYSNVKEFVVKFMGQETEKNVYKKESLIKNFKHFSIVYEVSDTSNTIKDKDETGEFVSNFDKFSEGIEPMQQSTVSMRLPNAAMSGNMGGSDPHATALRIKSKELAKISGEITGDELEKVSGIDLSKNPERIRKN